MPKVRGVIFEGMFCGSSQIDLFKRSFLVYLCFSTYWARVSPWSLV